MLWREQIEDVVRHARALLARRGGRLEALALTVPAEAPDDEVRRSLVDALARAGHPGVAVSTRPADGPLRLLSVEFRR